MDSEALEKLIKGRRSIRRWTSENVPDELLIKAVELATWAPNGGNFQGWHFKIVRNKAIIIEVADAVQSVADKVATWPEAWDQQEAFRHYQKNASLFRSAPACIFVFANKYQSPMDRVLSARAVYDREAADILACRRSSPTAVQSAAAAVATMLLVFHHMGLGALWLSGPLIAKREIEAILKKPENSDFVCMVAVGYPDEWPSRERRPVEQAVSMM
jgi:nitroreductase